MTSTSVFFGQAATMTVHMPPGSTEAALMIESLDQAASITLPIDEVRRLVDMLQAHAIPVEETDHEPPRPPHE